MAHKPFCDNCGKEIKCKNPTPYFDSKAKMLDFCKPCYTYSQKIIKKHRKMMQKLITKRDEEVKNIKKSWWKRWY